MPIARVIDYETTGTPDNPDAEVIEMAKVDVIIEDGKFLWEPSSNWRSFCLPRGKIPPETKAIHHITEADVRNAPQARELWSTLLDDLGDDDLIVAHNAKFEQHFTPPVSQQWIDTYKVARVLWPDAPGHSNQCLRYWRGLIVGLSPTDMPHRALPDAIVTAVLLVDMLHACADRPEALAWMINVSRYPALLRRLTFGKHKGTAYEDAPTDYLEWIVTKSDMDEDTKFTARYWLKKRA